MLIGCSDERWHPEAAVCLTPDVLLGAGEGAKERSRGRDEGERGKGGYEE